MAGLIGAATAVVLVTVAAVHGYWAQGGHWPAPDRSHLGDTVVGPGQQMPPAWATWAVAGLLITAAALIAAAGLGAQHWIVRLGAAVVGGVLALRAVTGFIVSGLVRPGSTFARLDIRYFSPLCLALAAGAFTSLG